MGAYDAQIWSYLYQKIGNEKGVAALMGNLFAESALSPTNLQNTYETSLGYTDASYTAAVDSGAYSKDSFVYDEAGYGLAQWTYWSRKKAMYEMWKSGGYSSIGSIDLALDFLYYELTHSYTGVYSVLVNATDILTASNKVLFDFENPADQSTNMQNIRYNYSVNFYNTYATGTDIDPETPVDPPSGDEGGGGSGGGNGAIKYKPSKLSKILFYAVATDR